MDSAKLSFLHRSILSWQRMPYIMYDLLFQEYTEDTRPAQEQHARLQPIRVALCFFVCVERVKILHAITHPPCAAQS